MAVTISPSAVHQLIIQRGDEMAEGIQVRSLQAIGDREIQGLSNVLISCVEGGASVSFMLPITPAKAEAYWRGVGESLARGERLVFAAEDLTSRDETSRIVGTVQIILSQPENQPHRADLAKMLVHERARRRGVGAALLTAAEQGALAAGKTLLVLDTGSDEAERLYVRGGWQRCGVIPDFALWPGGGYCATTFYYKMLGGVNPQAQSPAVARGDPPNSSLRGSEA